MKKTNCVKLIKKHSGDILSALSICGFVGTIVLVVKETPKVHSIINDEHEKSVENNIEIAKEVTRVYAPAILSASATITCILGANILNKRKQASLISAYSLINNYYNSYKDKVKEICGEETHNKVINEIVVEKTKNVDIFTQGLVSSSSLDIESDEEEKILFYDMFSARYFEATSQQVLKAEYHINRNFVLGETPSVNEFYEFLGLEPIPGGDEIIWTWLEGLYWIDFNHRKVSLEDGLEVYAIDMEWLPSAYEEA